MQLSFGFGPGDRPDASKLSAVLAAARRTALYGPLIARTAESGELALAQLSPIGIHTYIENKEQFRNPKAGAASGRRRAADDVLCGSLDELLRLATAPPATARRVTVRTPLGERLASESARDCLWRAFELPIFEELTGSEGEVLASECEAHSGLHLDTQSAIFEARYGELVVTSLVALRYPIIRLRTGWVGAIERSTCPCGERVTRFVPVAVAAAPVRKPPTAAQASRRPANHPAVAAV
jgi:hypothetical protein